MELPRWFGRGRLAGGVGVLRRVQLEGKRSIEFELNREVKQGASLSPLVLVIVMDKINKNTKIRTKLLKTAVGYRNLLSVKIENLSYVDDILLISYNHIWVEETEKLNMEINTEKS